MTNHFGKIIKFESNKVKANDPKPKYHLTVSLSQGEFLFINSNGFDECFPIDRKDWKEMPNEFSYISVNRIIRYTPEELKSVRAVECGEISKDCLVRLRDHLSWCEVLETAELVHLIKVFDRNLT